MKTLLTISICLFSLSAIAQLENHNWFFGDGMLLNFQEPLNLDNTASQNANNLRIASQISDADGNPLFYTDGANIYDANGDIMPNGTFSSLREESLVHPDPFNEDLYYVVRSGPQGTDYSVVDMTMNGGLGDIDPPTKETFIAQDYARLISTSNFDDSGRWMITISNSGFGSDLFIKVYEVLPEGGFDLSADNTYSYTFAGWENFIDDVAITRDCDLLAISFKGHYFVIFGFDNETGELTQHFDFAGDTGDFFGAISRVEFSPSGQFLFVMGENSLISRFDISSLDQPTVVNTQEDVSVQLNNMNDIKLGPDDRMYLLGNGNSRIDAISNLEVNINELEYEASVFEESLGGNYFPNTPNVFCGLVVPFFNLPPQEACLGEEFTLDLGYNFEPDSLLWDLGIEVEDESILETLEPTLEYPLGTYPVSAEIWLDSLFYTVESTVQVFEFPEIELGEDQTLCQGDEIVLDPGDANEYLWNTGSTDSTLTVTEGGTFSVEAANGACAVTDEVTITFIPQLSPDAGGDVVVCDEEEYTIEANISGEWNTGETGSSITVDESGLYTLTVSNICFTSTDSVGITFVNVPESQLPESLSACDGEVITLDPEVEADSYLWNTEEETASIEVTESGTYSVVMDYQGCPLEDESSINFIPQLNPDAGGDVVLCDEFEYTITSTIPGEWNTGETGPSITVTETGLYTVTVGNECFTSTDSVGVSFVTVPFPQLPEGLTGCIGDTFILDPGIDADTYVWNTGDAGSTLEVGFSGSYTVSMDYQGCPVEDEVEVIFEEYIPVESLIIPNIFSPNGDSINDVFRLSNSVLPDEDPCDFPRLTVGIEVYNRWGNLVRDGICEWDGKNAGGDALSEGVYYYLIEVEAVCFGRTEEKELEGSLTLVR